MRTSHHAAKHPEHLNTPRLVANDQQQTVWKWDQQEPFGANACNPDPDGDNLEFEFNLRFPGQYFDRETNQHYNYFRDYDPAVGRYVQSDPIGLDGGVNTYVYARGNPTRYWDSYGLEPGDLSMRGYPNPRIPFPISWPPPPPGPPGSGCGDEATDCVIPDLYPESCKAHDRCYSIPGRDRAKCDWEFLKGMFVESGPFPNVLGPGAYYLAVRLRGLSAYERAQRSSTWP